MIKTIKSTGKIAVQVSTKPDVSFNAFISFKSIFGDFAVTLFKDFRRFGAKTSQLKIATAPVKNTTTTKMREKLRFAMIPLSCYGYF